MRIHGGGALAKLEASFWSEVSSLKSQVQVSSLKSEESEGRFWSEGRFTLFIICLDDKEAGLSKRAQFVLMIKRHLSGGDGLLR
jgi:hypothetical protein